MSQGNRPTREERIRRLRRRRQLRRARKAGAWSLTGLSVLGILMGLAVLLIVDQTLRAPKWVRDRVEARIERDLGGLQIEFGDVELVINEGWRPRAALRDVRLTDAEGRLILTLSDARASLAMRPMLEGQMQPKKVTLSGAFVVLRRNAAGTFSLAFDGEGAAVGEAQGPTQIVERLDSVLDRPQLAALTQIELSQVSLRYEDAVSGQAWTVDNGAFRLERDANQLRLASNLTLLTGRDYASEIEVNYSSDIGDAAASFGIALTDVPARDLASQFVAVSWLEPLRAPLSGAIRGSVNSENVLQPLNATLQIGQGVLQPTDETRPVPFEKAQAYFTYDPGKQVLQFDEISVVSDWVTGRAEATTFLGGLDRGQITELIGQMQLTTTSLNPGGLYPEPIVLGGAAADFRLELDPFTLTLGQLFIEDQGNELHLSGALRGTDVGWTVAMDAEMDALTPERLVALWPAQAIPRTRSWIERNLSGGRLSDVNVAMRLQPGGRPNVYLDFDYANTQIQFVRNLPPIRGAAGHASLIDNRFVTTATAGRVFADEGGPVDVSGTSFIIPDTSIRRAAPGIVRLRGRGSITSVLSLLNREPLQLLDKPGIPVDVAAGVTAFEGTIALPLKKRVELDEVSFFADGLATDVASDRLVPGKELIAPVVEVRATDKQVEILGDGRISGVPFTGRWRQVLGQPGAGSQLDGTIALGPETLEVFDITLPPGAVSGSGEGDFLLDLQQQQPPRLQLTSTLEGLRLAIPELGWIKSADRPGALSVTARLGPAPEVDALILDAPGLSAAGQVTTVEGGGLQEARFNRFRLGNWLDVSARLLGQGVGLAPKIRIESGTLDLRLAQFQPAPDANAAPVGDDALLAKLDRLQVTDTISLTGFDGRFALRGGLAGPFQARINDQTPISGLVVPEEGRSAVRVQSNDAGGVIRDAGILKQAREGSFDMTLRPVGEPGNFEGAVEVRDTFVRDGPAIGALLNAVSIVGLVNELAGQGILFSEVSARFRLSPSRITLYESRATGPSMGLTMDGVYDVPNQSLDMQGVLSPVYVLNQIGGVLAPRRGEGLIGFNYMLSGPAQNPRVSVNPLSALTPGFFREIFREPPPEPPPVDDGSGLAPEPPASRAVPKAPSAGDR